jgi:Fic family protein
VTALEHGLKTLRDGLPLCTRLLCEMHKVLLTHPGGYGKTPGEVRRSQVWIGGTRPGNAAFVPPPADALPECLTSLERFLNDDPEPVPPLIVLQLVADGVLREPMLYPSLFFKTHRALYYELLNEVRLRGDWERWLDFFAEGIEVSATQAVATANALLALVNADRDYIAGLGRAAASALTVHQALQRQPIATSAALVKATGLTPATVNKSLAHLERIGIVAELTNRQRGRVFSYRRYVEQLAAELEARG